MTDEEFSEFYWSLTDDEKIEVSRQLADFAKANKEALNISDETIAERDEKLERFANAVAQQKQVKKLLHEVQNQLDLVEQRINARLLDKMETESSRFFDDDKNNKSH